MRLDGKYVHHPMIENDNGCMTFRYYCSLTGKKSYIWEYLGFTSVMTVELWNFVFVMPDGTDSNIVTVRVRANTQLRNLSSRMRNMSRPKQNH